VIAHQESGPSPEAAACSVLLTVSGNIVHDARAGRAEGSRPRADYDLLATAMSGVVIDYAEARRSAPAGQLITRILGPDVALAWALFRRRRDVTAVFTDSERVGMLYATLCSVVRERPRHVMIGHRLSAPAKLRMHRLLRLGRTIDHVVVYAGAQRTVAIEQLGYPPQRVTLTPFMVDTRFWRPDGLQAPKRERPMICAAGQELRDYPTLVRAVEGLDVDVVIAAASPWSKRADTAAEVEPPANVSVVRIGHFDLRQLYAEATLVVVPIQPTDFQAGITTILEAMSMGRAVVCTRTSGQVDTIDDRNTGRYVLPGDAAALRSVIAELLADDEQRDRIAAAGQRWARDQADIERYANRLAAIVRDVGQ
jgi:glycosyltransferase involved in cell wall biosynthesis